MKLIDRLETLERACAGGSTQGPMLVVFLNMGERHLPPVTISTGDGGWRIERDDGESEEAFLARAEASAPCKRGALLILALERELPRSFPSESTGA